MHDPITTRTTTSPAIGPAGPYTTNFAVIDGPAGLSMAAVDGPAYGPSQLLS